MDRRLSRAAARMRQERERGAAAVEYLGIVIAVAALACVLVVVFASTGTNLADRAKAAICQITGGSGCGSSEHDAGDSGNTGDNGDTGDAGQSFVADVPDGLDPASELVKALQSTARGREVLQWLADHGIQIVIDPTATGAYWDGTRIVMGPGFQDAATLVHEANHARYTKEGRSADASALSRNDYVRGQIAEETDGVVQEIEAAKEFRAAGQHAPAQYAEGVYDNAYENAKANGASDAEARQAGHDAIEQEFYNGGFVTSTDGKSYPDYYGDFWDSVH